MKWSVKKLFKNEYITLEGVTIGTDATEIEVADENKSAIRAVKNTLSRLKREKRIEVLSGDVPEKASTVYAKKGKQPKAEPAPVERAAVTEQVPPAKPVKPKAAKPEAQAEGVAAAEETSQE